MLRATVEIVPFGIEDHPNKRVIGTITIGLQGVTDGIGHYTSRIETDQRGPQPTSPVVHLDHARHLGGFELVKRCIEEHWSE